MFERTTDRRPRLVRPLRVEVDHTSQTVRLTLDGQQAIMTMSNWTFAIANAEYVDLSIQRHVMDEINAGTPA